MTTWYQRVGECNGCGQCCGGLGTLPQPDRRTPFPRNWPEAIRYWSLDDAVQAIPQTGLCGLGQIGQDTIGVAAPVGMVNIQGHKFYYVWLAGIGLVKDSSAQHDGSSYEPQCPFLLDVQGDGTMPCGLVGTNQDGAYLKWCQLEPSTPREEQLVQEWQWRFPDCSYTWEPIP